MRRIRGARRRRPSEDEASGHAAFAEGSVRFVSRKVTRAEISAPAIRGDGQVMTAEELGSWLELRL